MWKVECPVAHQGQTAQSASTATSFATGGRGNLQVDFNEMTRNTAPVGRNFGRNVHSYRKDVLCDMCPSPVGKTRTARAVRETHPGRDPSCSGRDHGGKGSEAGPRMGERPLAAEANHPRATAEAGVAHLPMFLWFRATT